MEACVNLCCKRNTCDIALMLRDSCYSITCASEELCEEVPAPSSDFYPRLSYVRRDIESQSKKGMKYYSLKLKNPKKDFKVKYFTRKSKPGQKSTITDKKLSCQPALFQLNKVSSWILTFGWLQKSATIVIKLLFFGHRRLIKNKTQRQWYNWYNNAFVRLGVP